MRETEGEGKLHSLLTTCSPRRFGSTPGPCINSGGPAVKLQLKIAANFLRSLLSLLGKKYRYLPPTSIKIVQN